MFLKQSRAHLKHFILFCVLLYDGQLGVATKENPGEIWGKSLLYSQVQAHHEDYLGQTQSGEEAESQSEGKAGATPFIGGAKEKQGKAASTV